MATKRINQLAQTATAADLVPGNKLVIDTLEATKALPVELLAKSADTAPRADIASAATSFASGDIGYVDGSLKECVFSEYDQGSSVEITTQAILGNIVATLRRSLCNEFVNLQATKTYMPGTIVWFFGTLYKVTTRIDEGDDPATIQSKITRVDLAAESATSVKSGTITRIEKVTQVPSNPDPGTLYVVVEGA